MALVRCPVHKIPYNDENPRGCPACAREGGGKGRVSVMQELAKAQKAEAPAEKPAEPDSGAAPKISVEQRGAPPTHPAYRPPSAAAAWQPPVTTESPVPPKRSGVIRENFRSIAVGIVIVLVVIAYFTAGPQFREGMFPAAAVSNPRPLPLDPNVSITSAFGMLGSGEPKANPDSPRLARYTYGSDLMVDAVNGVIYAITVRIPNRSWRGLHAGMPEQTARGALSLLGEVIEAESAEVPQPEELRGYWVYPSLDQRPRRTLSVQVRPPNGCFEIQVDIQPQAIGTLDDGDNRYAVVGTESAALDWVVTQVRIVSSSLRGPYSGVPAC